jgi:hypothetical protein
LWDAAIAELHVAFPQENREQWDAWALDVEENDAYLGAAIFETLTSASVSLRTQCKNDGPYHYLPQRRKAISDRYFQAFVKRFLHILEPYAESPIDDHDEWLKDPARIKKAKEAAVIRWRSELRAKNVTRTRRNMKTLDAMQQFKTALNDSEIMTGANGNRGITLYWRTPKQGDIVIRFQGPRSVSRLHGMDRRFIYL